MTGWLIASSRVVDSTISQHSLSYRRCHCSSADDPSPGCRVACGISPGGAASPILEQFATHDGGKYYDRSYYAPTPNGHKITLFLEEAELAYRLIRVDIGKGEQFHPQFLAISPNNKVPAIVDHMPADGGAPLSVFESGAILLYLAEKAVSC